MRDGIGQSKRCLPLPKLGSSVPSAYRDSLRRVAEADNHILAKLAVSDMKAEKSQKKTSTVAKLIELD